MVCKDNLRNQLSARIQAAVHLRPFRSLAILKWAAHGSPLPIANITDCSGLDRCLHFRSLAHSLFGRSLLRGGAVCSRDIFLSSVWTDAPVGTESVLTLHPPHGRGGQPTSQD